MRREDESLLRKETNYFLNQFGVDEKSILNSIENYHVTNNLSIDRTHDIQEGIAHGDLFYILKLLITDKKIISVQYLNLKMNSMFYTIKHSRNEPPLLNNDVLSHNKIKMSAY